MAYYYYDRTGKKGPFNQTQLQIQVNNRKVLKETPVETDGGQSGQAGQLVWLVFPPDRKRIIFGLFSGFGSFVSGIFNAIFLILVVAVLAVALGELSCRLLYKESLAEFIGWVQPSIQCSSKETCLTSLAKIKDSYSKKDKEYRDEHKETISELNRLAKALKDGTIDFAKVQESILEELDKRTLEQIDAKDLSRLIDKWIEEAEKKDDKDNSTETKPSVDPVGLFVDVFSARNVCTNKLKQIGIGMHNFHDTYINALPALYTIDEKGKPLHSWRVLILPFVEETGLYKKIRLNEPWNSEYNKQFHSQMPKAFACPSNKVYSPDKACCYSAIAGKTVKGHRTLGGALAPAEKSGDVKGKNGFHNLIDGLSNTILCIEVKEPFCWMDPTADIDFDELSKGINVPGGRVGSFHSGGCNVVMGDGAVQFFSDAISSDTLIAYGTRNGGESVAPSESLPTEVPADAAADLLPFTPGERRTGRNLFRPDKPTAEPKLPENVPTQLYIEEKPVQPTEKPADTSRDSEKEAKKRNEHIQKMKSIIDNGPIDEIVNFDEWVKICSVDWNNTYNVLTQQILQYGTPELAKELEAANAIINSNSNTVDAVESQKEAKTKKERILLQIDGKLNNITRQKFYSDSKISVNEVKVAGQETSVELTTDYRLSKDIDWTFCFSGFRCVAAQYSRATLTGNTEDMREFTKNLDDYTLRIYFTGTKYGSILNYNTTDKRYEIRKKDSGDKPFGGDPFSRVITDRGGGNNPSPAPPNPNKEWEQKKQDAIAAIGKIVDKIRTCPIANGKKEAVQTLNKFQERIEFLINELEFTGGEKLIVIDQKRRFTPDAQDFDVEKFLNCPPREQWDMILYAAYDRSDIINPSRGNVEFVKKLKGIRTQLPEKWKDEEK